jgi:hypothetical protein
MNSMRTILAALIVAGASATGSYLLLAQQQPPAPAGGGGQGRGPATPPQPMSFFVTSVGKGDGANYGGLAGLARTRIVNNWPPRLDAAA